MEDLKAYYKTEKDTQAELSLTITPVNPKTKTRRPARRAILIAAVVVLMTVTALAATTSGFRIWRENEYINLATPVEEPRIYPVSTAMREFMDSNEPERSNFYPSITDNEFYRVDFSSIGGAAAFYGIPFMQNTRYQLDDQQFEYVKTIIPDTVATEFWYNAENDTVYGELHVLYSAGEGGRLRLFVIYNFSFNTVHDEYLLSYLDGKNDGSIIEYTSKANGIQAVLVEAEEQLGKGYLGAGFSKDAVLYRLSIGGCSSLDSLDDLYSLLEEFIDGFAYCSE